MPSVETFYLIDFENVHEDGLSGSANLGSHDHIYLFYTKNVPKISIKELAGLHSANLSTLEIPNGNQSLDMHLVSYLGYLIGTNTNNKCKYVIISKDTDYDNIVSFWKSKSGSDITRQNEIAPPKPAKSTNTTTLINSKVQKLLSSAGFSNDIINPIASLVSKHHREKNGKQTVYRSIVAKYGQKRGLNIYNHIKNSF